jgi:hypothetical protein
MVVVVGVVLLGLSARARADLPFGTYSHSGPLFVYPDRMPTCGESPRNFSFKVEEDPITHEVKLRETLGPEWVIKHRSREPTLAFSPADALTPVAVIADVMVGSRDVVVGSVRTVSIVHIVRRDNTARRVWIGFAHYTLVDNAWQEVCRDAWIGPASGP